MEDYFEGCACLNCDNNLGDGCAVNNEAYNDICSDDCPDFILVHNIQGVEEEPTEINTDSACFVCNHNFRNRCTLFSLLYNKIRFPDECPDFVNIIEHDEEFTDSLSADDTNEDSVDDTNDLNDRLDYLNNHTNNLS